MKRRSPEAAENARTEVRTSRPATAAPRHLPGGVYLLAGIGTLMATTEQAMAGLVPEVSASLQTSEAQGGLLITACAVGVMIGAPGGAILNTRIHHRTVLIVALSLFALIHAVAAASNGFELLFVARFMTGLATGCYWATIGVVVTRLAGHGAGARGMGTIMIGVTTAAIIGVPSATITAQTTDWRVVFAAFAVLGAVAIVPILRLLRGEGSAASAGARESFLQSVAVLRKPKLWLVYAAMALLQAGTTTSYAFFPAILAHFAVAAALLPVGQLLFGVGGLTGATFGGRMGDRRPWVTALVGAAGLLAGLVAVAVAGQMPAAVLLIGIGLIGLLGMLPNPTLMSRVASISTPFHEIPVALNPVALNGGVALGSFVGSRVIDGPYGPQAGPLVGAALAAAGLAAIAILAATSGRNMAPARSSARS